MAIFISYSHEDTKFVDSLAMNLIREKHHVWLDRWELNIGDSLTAKIEESLTTSSAILIILSQHSIQSNWCKRELTAGLLRELEESKTLVLPIIVDDCQIPLFLRDKLYADFRKDPDAAFSLVDRALSKISNSSMSRVESPEFFTDFSYDWKRRDVDFTEETWQLRWTFIHHSPKLEYVVLSECKIYQADGDQFSKAVSEKEEVAIIRKITKQLYDSYIQKGDVNGVITDNFTQFYAWEMRFSPHESYLVIYTFRRLGLDNGMNTAVYLSNNLKMALEHLDKTVAPTYGG